MKPELNVLIENLNKNPLTAGVTEENIWEELEKAGIKVEIKDLNSCLNCMYVAVDSEYSAFINIRLNENHRNYCAFRILTFHFFGPVFEDIEYCEMKIDRTLVVAFSEESGV